MFKRGYFLLVFATLFIFFSSCNVSANFVCGTVVNSNNSTDFSPSWMHVKIYYPENPASFATCQVSPDDNKYCCDPNKITNVSWAVGKTIKAEINEQGYVASPVNLIISGAGYDIFGDLQLEKIVNIIEPNSSIYLNASGVHVLASSAQQYNNVKYFLKQNDSIVQQNVVCENCTQADFYLDNLSFGRYELSLTAYNLNSEYTEKTNFTLLEYLGFTRSFECDGCSNKRVPSSAKNVTVVVTLNASDIVVGKLSDIFPADWIYQGNLQTDEVTDSHNSISWNANGNYIQERYVLKPPQNFFNSKYTFQSGFDSFLAQEDSVLLSKYHWLDFISLIKTYYKNVRQINISRTLSVTSSNPVVMQVQGSDVSEVAIFPKDTAKNVVSFVRTSQNLRLKDSRTNFIVWSNMKQSNIDKVFMKFKISTSKKNQTASLFYYDSSDDEWLNVSMDKTGEDEKYSYYEAFSNKTGTYSIKESK